MSDWNALCEYFVSVRSFNRSEYVSQSWSPASSAGQQTGRTNLNWVWTAKSDKSIQTLFCCSESVNRLTDSQCFLSIIWSIQTQSRINRFWIISELQSLSSPCLSGRTCVLSSRNHKRHLARIKDFQKTSKQIPEDQEKIPRLRIQALA